MGSQKTKTIVEREELLRLFNNITDPIKQKNELYGLLDALKITYKQTNCKHCLIDYYNLVREELGLIESAAEISEFNNEDDSQQVQTVLRYVWPRPVSWKGHIINDRTPESVKREFHKTHKGFYIEQATIPFETK